MTRRDASRNEGGALTLEQRQIIGEALKGSRTTGDRATLTAALCGDLDVFVALIRQTDALLLADSEKKQAFGQALDELRRHLESALRACRLRSHHGWPNLSRWQAGLEAMLAEVAGSRARIGPPKSRRETRRALPDATLKPWLVAWLEQHGVPTGGTAAATILGVALEAAVGRAPEDAKREMAFARARGSKVRLLPGGGAIIETPAPVRRIKSSRR